MKLLIVEDEIPVRRSIRLLVKNAQLEIDEILEADNAAAAFKILESERPQLIISDVVMPGMNGVDFSKAAKAKYPDVSIIIVSGYDDYQYIRESLKCGSLDYLLKPLSREQLYSALANAIEEQNAIALAKHKKNEEQAHLQQLSNLVRLSYLTDLLHHPFEQIQSKFREQLPSFQNYPGACMCYFPFGHLNAVQKPTQRQAESLFSSCAESNGIVFFDQQENDSFICIFPSRPTAQYLTDLLRETHRALGFVLPCVVSSSRPFPQKTHEQYKECRFIWRHTDLRDLQRRSILSCSDISFEPEEWPGEFPLFERLENELLDAILSGRQDDIKRVLQYYIGLVCEKSSCTLSVFRQLEMRISQLVARCAESIGVYEKNTSINCRLSVFTSGGLFSTTEMGRQLAEDIIGLSKEFQFRRHNSRTIIRRIIAYMEEHSAEHFRQSDYADRFFINKDYLSRKFKTETGLCMVNYLNRIRIKKAKVLLTGTEMSVGDIASQVGFVNEKYFSRIFRKEEGVSPKKYRIMMDPPSAQSYSP